MSSIDNLAKDLVKIMHKTDEKGPKPYEPIATVVKEDENNGDILWVKIPGSDSDTPVEKTINANPGDSVRVRVSGGRAWVVGNASNPPTDDARANQIGAAAQPSIDFVAALADKDVTVKSITAATGYIDDLYSKNITTENLKAAHAYIDELEAKDVTTNKLKAATGYIDDLTSKHITADYIEADHIDVNSLKANKADINLANVKVAWIEQGNIKKAEVFDENVFDLSGNRATLSRIDASKINVANLRADNLVVRRINGQPVVGGYTLIDSNSPGYESKNPQALGWYEFVNAQWVLSTDTTVDMTKAYYQEGNEVSLYDQAYIDGLENDLQQQIDGAVETFTGSVVPTLTNWPYTEWYDTSVTPIHDERAKHVGDIYYVVNSSSDEDGYCYRFAYDNTEHAYSWVLIKDSDVTKALSDISELQTFESETTSWIDETDEGLETIRTNHTALSGRVDDVEATANAALPAATFETFESTTFTDVVDEVNEQSTTMTNMTTRLGLNADGTQSATDIVSKESALEQTVDGISTRVGKTEMHLAGMYATSSTAAGTAAKVATIVPTLANYELANGAMVTVKFVNDNTTSSPTLNLNSTGAKPIKTYSGGNLTEAEYKWKAGSTFTFTYNGTNWLMQDSTEAVRINNAETSITQTADSIISLASGNTTYTKPDGTTATSAIGTTVSQTANNVLIKATRTGATDAEKTAGGTSAVGLINVSPDNVVIAAKHVDIAGAAIFNSYSTTQQMNSAIGTAVDGIEVGGRNLQEKSNDGTQYSWSQTGGAFTKTVNNEGATFTITTLPASGSWGVFQITGALRDKIKACETYTLSYDLMTTNSISDIIASFNIRKGNGSLPIMDEGSEQYVTFSTTANTWKHIEHTNTAKATLPAMDYQWLYISLPQLKDQLGSFSIKNVKVEKGNKATDWTPAPEDVQAEIDAKKSTHTLTASNTGGTTYATILSWAQEGTSVTFGVTSTAGVKIGDTVRIAYKAVDMGTGGTIVYVLGTVTSVNNATSLNVISHGLDTTVIDGGHILTGTIDASKVNVSNLTVGSFGSTEQNKILNDKIQVGGRNLLLGTARSDSWVSNHSSGSFTTRDCYQTYLPVNTLFKQNDLVTISFDWSTNSTGGNYHVECGNVTPWGWGTIIKASGTRASNSQFVDITSSNQSGHVEITFQITSAQVAATDSFRWLRIRSDGDAMIGKTITISNAKAEFGNQATAWTPALEDDSSGKNLMRYTHKLSIGTVNSGAATYSTGTDTTVPSGQYLRATTTTAHAGGIHISTGNLGFDYNGQMVNGTTYTFSAWVRSSMAFTFSALGPERFSPNSIKITKVPANTWTYVWCTGVFNTNTQFLSCPFYTNSTWEVGSTLDISSMKLELGSQPTPWTPAPGDMSISYMHADSNGLRIASANPATQNQRIVLTSSQMSMYDDINIERLRLNSGTGVLVGRPTAGHTVVNDTGLNVYDNNNVLSGYFYGETARIGRGDRGRVDIASAGIDMYGYDANASTANQNLCHIGFASGNAQSGTKYAPYYTFGSRYGSSIGNYSFAAGVNCEATAHASQTFGANTKTTKAYQMAIGQWNAESANALFMIGSGSSVARKNVFEVSNLGHVIMKSYLTLSGSIEGASCLEFTGASGTNGGYIDFHYGGSTSDYTSRIWENGSGQIAITGKLTVGNGLAVTGYLSVSDYIRLATNNKPIFARDASNADIDIMRFDSNNDLVIGYGSYSKNTSGYDTWLEGYNVYLRARQKCYSNGSQISTSDRRLKKDILPISDRFRTLFMDLKPVEYKLRDSEDKDIHLGLIAQDVESSFDKSDITADDYALVDEYRFPEEEVSYKALAYTEFIPLCIKMIQSQQKEIETLTAEVKAIKEAR